ncbi:MAG: elongation factor P [Erythrobacter sp.]
MKAYHIALLALCAAGLAATLQHPAFGQDRTAIRPQPGRGAVIGDMLGTMQHGFYQCALPGNATGDAFIEQPEESFRIGAGSSYESAAGGGVYLMHGTTLIFTRGPKKDQRFRRIGANTLQALEDGDTLGRMICTRLGGVD